MAPTSEITNLHPRTDRRIVVGDGEDARTFGVSSYAMCLACPAWERMFKPPDPNARITYVEQSAPEITFPDDDPEAMELVLRVVHRSQTTREEPPDVELVTNIAMLCDKYDLVYEMKDWMKNWESALIPQIDVAEKLSYCSLSSGATPGGHVINWLNISYVFGWKKHFETTLGTVARYAIIEDEEGKRILSYCGKDASIRILPDIGHRIIEIRDTTIASVIELVRGCFKKLLDERQCHCLLNDKSCDAIIFRSLVQSSYRDRSRGIISLPVEGVDESKTQPEPGPRDIKVSFHRLYFAMLATLGRARDTRTPEAQDSHRLCESAIMGERLEQIWKEMDDLLRRLSQDVFK